MATSPALSVKLSEPQRLLNTFVAPAKTFEDLKQNSSWWVPWLIGSIVALLFVYTIDKKITFEQSTINQIEKSSRAEQFDKLPPEQKAQQLAISTKITKIISYSMPALILVINIIIASVLLGMFNLGFGAALPFKRVLAIVFYGGLPFVISNILAIVSMQFIDPEAFNVQNPVATNPAYFMDPYNSSKFLYGVASAFDIFVFWVIALMAIGISRNSKVKTGTAFGAILALYFVYKLIAAGMASIF